jgi:glycosyltransferase involved in cell wall biosynthesis
MRIGIDARFYGPLGKGLGRYTQKLIENLEKVDLKDQYVIFLRKENFDLYQPKNPHFSKVLADYPWYSVTEQILMPVKIRRSKVSLMHFPHFNVPIFYKGKFVVTIHDLILLQFPTIKATTLSPLMYSIKQAGYKFVIRHAVKRAKKVITVSNYTKKELIKYFGLDPDKIVVTYEACDTSHNSEFPPTADQPQAGRIQNSEPLKKFGISKSYLLYIGNAYPHKNLEGLLLAFKKLIKEYKLDLQLVLVGKEDYFFRKLKEKVKKLNLPAYGWSAEGGKSPVVFPGFVSDEGLQVLYRNALLYVFPSFCEGFGLPPLEAQAQGLPVVASNSSSLPEILEDTVEYFNPHKIDEMAKVIAKVVNNEGLRNKLKEKGLEHVKKFSWEKCARETLKAYKSVV